MPVAHLDIFADDCPWAITPSAIDALQRELPNIEALASRIGQPVNGAGRSVENHDGTAVLDIRGPLFRYRSIWTWLLGGTALEDAAIGLGAALDDPAVRAIVLAINSPGGQIDGINEFANKIRAANAQKPVTAYVGAMAASGAYWLASAAGRIVADETAQLGSIGVLATVLDDSKAAERSGVKRYDVVSSQSPLKRTDPATDEGRAQLQKLVDGLAQVFIEKVAKFRGTSAERVASDFGRGAVLPARDAVAAGMADALGSLEGLMGDGSMPMDGPMRQMRDKPGMRVAAQSEDSPFDEEELEDDTDDQQLNNAPGCDDEDGDEDDESEGTEQDTDDSSIPRGETALTNPTAERQRIAAILNCEEARGREELARTLALETDTTPEAARKLLAAAPVAAKPAANPLEARMGQIQNPRVGIDVREQADDSPAAEVQRILAFVPQDRLRAHARIQQGTRVQ